MDIYMDHTQEPRVLQLTLENADCNISRKQCLFSAGQSEIKLELSVYLEDGVTVVNSNTAMYRISLFTVDAEGNAEEFQLGMDESPFYWRADMDLANKLARSPNGLTMRIIAMQDVDSYISQFSAR